MHVVSLLTGPPPHRPGTLLQRCPKKKAEVRRGGRRKSRRRRRKTMMKTITIKSLAFKGDWEWRWRRPEEGGGLLLLHRHWPLPQSFLQSRRQGRSGQGQQVTHLAVSLILLHFRERHVHSSIKIFHSTLHALPLCADQQHHPHFHLPPVPSFSSSFGQRHRYHSLRDSTSPASSSASAGREWRSSLLQMSYSSEELLFQAASNLRCIDGRGEEEEGAFRGRILSSGRTWNLFTNLGLGGHLNPNCSFRGGGLQVCLSLDTSILSIFKPALILMTKWSWFMHVSKLITGIFNSKI